MTKTEPALTSFAVDPFSASEASLPVEKVHLSIKKLLGTPIEACDSYHADVVEQPGFHSLFAAAHLAYQHHLPLVLTPDSLWLTLAQGLAYHVNNHAEVLRSRLVPHQGKKLIEVRRDEFKKGSPENPWTEVWPEFSLEIKKAIGPKSHALILCDFSTTGPTERAASEVVLMDCVQSFFDYEFHTLCGIPKITLEGTVEDWEKLHEKATQLAHFDLEWWISDVSQITTEFVRAAKGHPNQTFWRAIYKQQNDSGGPYTSGWLLRLLPYLKQQELKFAKDGELSSAYPGPWRTDLRNPWIGKPLLQKPGSFDGITDSQLPAAISKVPFVWNYLDVKYHYEFLAGVLTVEQDKVSKGIRPRIGWAVRPAPREAKSLK